MPHSAHPLPAQRRADQPISVGFVGSIGRACFSDLVLRACPGMETCYRTGSRRALLAAVATGALDIAVYPGAIEPGAATMPLCEDRLEAAMAAAHPLASLAAVPLATLRLRSVLLPLEGDEGDFRRLVQTLVPGMAQVAERPMAQVLERLAIPDALALVAAGQVDDLGAAVVARPIAGVDTSFAVYLAWSAGAPQACLHDLLALLADGQATPSPLPAR